VLFHCEKWDGKKNTKKKRNFLCWWQSLIVDYHWLVTLNFTPKVIFWPLQKCYWKLWCRKTFQFQFIVNIILVLQLQLWWLENAQQTFHTQIKCDVLESMRQVKMKISTSLSLWHSLILIKKTQKLSHSIKECNKNQIGKCKCRSLENEVEKKRGFIMETQKTWWNILIMQFSSLSQFFYFQL
jgi:hypothetical protein